MLKFSGDGDGARFAKSAKYVLVSFSLPSLCDDALTAAGNHTFAAVKCSEGYESLKNALEPVLAEMNELIKEGEIVVDGVTVKLDIKLGSDMKFMLIVLGLNAANSKYACMWCHRLYIKRDCIIK